MVPVYRRINQIGFLAIIFSALTVAAMAQDSDSLSGSPTPGVNRPIVSVVQDWSTKRVIYTRNGSVDDMLKVRNDPRFLNSFLLHNVHPAAAAAMDGELPEFRGENPPVIDPNLPVKPGPKMKVDWAVSLGPTYGMAIGESPAKFSFNPNAVPVCSNLTAKPPVVGDFVVYSVKAAPSVGHQANLVGLTNLYSNSAGTGFCSGTGTTGQGPSVLFSYAIGTGASYLSPALSLDGTKVAWIETTSSNHAVLHVTTWAANEGTNATTGAVAVDTENGTCVSGKSCDVSIDYTSSAYSGCTASIDSNTNSEIYVDYASGNAFVGADNGILYHVKSIFGGAPSIDFCISVNSGAGIGLGGGVYDTQVSPPVFYISDSKKLYVYEVNATSFTLSTSYTYALATQCNGGTCPLTGPGPVLDAFNHFIYVFSADDNASHTSVTQISTKPFGSTVAVTPLGPASTNSWPVLFYGAYDNNYFNNGPAHANSTLYSCGADSTTANAQDLFAINFNTSTGVMNTTPLMSANKNVNPGGHNGTCSPITEFFDGTTDRIFVGEGEHLATSGANSIQMWTVTTPLTSPTATPTQQLTTYAGGSSGIIVDNNASPTKYPQAESIYFTTLSEGTTFTTCGASLYCAVKLTQSALQ
ncbi:MAG TPA: hypothetical protein VL983_10535 [Terriglobales bacterium]|nr:hypothetical protein [Terriglobales bacterium]